MKFCRWKVEQQVTTVSAGLKLLITAKKVAFFNRQHILGIFVKTGIDL